MKGEDEGYKATNILTGEEIQGIITLVVIFLLGFFTSFTSAWWLRVIGWVVMGLTALSAWKIGKGIEIRLKEQKIEQKKKEIQLNKELEALKK